MYSREDFVALTDILNINEFVQLPTAQVANATIKQNIPSLLVVTTFTNHVEIMNRCRTDEERIFYMLYASHQRLKTEELRRCIVNQTYSSLMDKEKMFSPRMLAEYPNTEFMLNNSFFIWYNFITKTFY